MSANNTNTATEEQKLNTTSSSDVTPEIQLSDDEDRVLGYIERKALNTIRKPGKYSVRVSNTRPGITNQRGEVVTIINFAAITQYQLDQAYAAVMEGMLEDAGNFGLSSNARLGTADYCPSPGEYVYVQIEERPTKAGVDKNGVVREASTGLFVVSVTPQPPVEAVATDVRAQIMARKAEAAAKLAGK